MEQTLLHQARSVLTRSSSADGAGPDDRNLTAGPSPSAVPDSRIHVAHQSTMQRSDIGGESIFRVTKIKRGKRKPSFNKIRLLGRKIDSISSEVSCISSFDKASISNAKVINLFWSLIDVHDCTYEFIFRKGLYHKMANIAKFTVGRIIFIIRSLHNQNDRNELVIYLCTLILEMTMDIGDKRSEIFRCLEINLSYQSSYCKPLVNQVVLPTAQRLNTAHRKCQPFLSSERCYSLHYNLGLAYIRTSNFEQAKASFTMACQYCHDNNLGMYLDLIESMRSDYALTDTFTRSSDLRSNQVNAWDYDDLSVHETLKLAHCYITSAQDLLTKSKEKLKSVVEPLATVSGIRLLCRKGYSYEIFGRLDKGSQILFNLHKRKLDLVSTEDFVEISYVIENAAKVFYCVAKFANVFHSVIGSGDKNKLGRILINYLDDLTAWYERNQTLQTNGAGV